MNNLPIQIRQQYEQFQSLMESKTIFGAMVKFRDLTEVMLRLPVLCAGAFILEKGGSERELLTIELVRHDKIDGGGWFKIAKLIGSNKNIPKPLQNAISHVYGFIKSESILEWRNAEVAHGALKFNPDKAFMRDFDRKIKALKKILKKLDRDFKDITVTPDGSSVTFENATLSVVPYIHSDDGEAYLFNSFKDGLATGLCYALGIKHPMPSEQYLQAYKTQGTHRQTKGVTSDVITTELNALIDELNEAANFEYPIYLRDWLVECMNANGSGIKKGTLMLEMERGMGKSAFSRALDGKSTDKEYRSFKISDTFTRGYYCSRISIKSKGDFLYGIRNCLLTDANEKPLYSSDEKIPSLTQDSTPEDFAELLNWCHDHISERKLLLIIDGIDEIPSEHVSILKMLPSADMLNNGIYILLTCRSNVELPKDKKEEDYTPEEKILLNENKHIDIVKSLVSPDRHRAYLRDDENNFEVLKAYFDHKIFSKGKAQKKDVLEDLIKQPGNLRFLEVRIIGALCKSEKIRDINKFLKQPDLFHYYMDYLRTEEYGDAVFSRLTDVMVALACAQEQLTFDELAYILGEDDVTIQLLTFIRDMSGILRISRDYRGNHIGLASDAYRDTITGENSEATRRHKVSLADILHFVDIDAAKIKKDDNTETLPDGLIYIAAYLPTVVDVIPDDLFKKVYNDINNCIENRMEPYILSRRANMGEVWSGYCGKVGLYKTQLEFINISGNCYWTMCDYSNALYFINKQVKLSKEYFTSGKIDDENYVAAAYMNRGVTYNTIGQHNEALSDYGKCIEIRERLHADGRLYDENYLAKTYMNRGITYDDIGKYAEALVDKGKGIEIMERLHKQHKLYDENDLASAYMNRGVTYRATGKYAEALSDYGKGIEVMERLHKQHKLYDENDLATAYMNRGVTYYTIGQHNEALADYGKCIEIRERLHKHGKLYDENDLAKAYMNRGNAFAQTGKYAEAMSDYGKGIEIMERLHKQHKLYDENDLAKAYMNRGNAFAQTGKYAEALSDYGKCIEIMERLHADGRLYDENDLATAYMGRGNAFAQTGKYAEALSDYGKCIEIRERLHADGKLYDLDDLATVMLNKGILLADGLNDQDGAMAIFNEAIGMLEAEEELSYSANDTLNTLYEVRNTLTCNSTPSNRAEFNDIYRHLESLDDEALNELVERITHNADEKAKKFFKSLSREQLIEVLAKVLRK